MLDNNLENNQKLKNELKEDSPYQVYINLYCLECNDRNCELIDFAKNMDLLYVNIKDRNRISECSKLRSLCKDHK